MGRTLNLIEGEPCELDPFLIRIEIWAYPWLLKTPLKALPTLTRSSLWYLIGWSAYSDIRSSWFYVMTSLSIFCFNATGMAL